MNRTSHVLHSVCTVFMGKREGEDNLTTPTSSLDLHVNCLLICMLLFTLHTNIPFLSHLKKNKKQTSLSISGQKTFPVFATFNKKSSSVKGNWASNCQSNIKSLNAV